MDAALPAALAAALLSFKPVPPPALPQGTPAPFVRLFNDGWRVAAKALERKDCAAFFAAHGAPAPRPVETMARTEYRFLALPQGATVGAQTNSEGSVFINTSGLFVTAEGGGIALNGRSYELGDASAVRAMILLHELGHQLGLFGPDSGPALRAQNARHSQDILDHCVPARPFSALDAGPPPPELLAD